MDSTTHEVRKSQWTAIIEQCQNRPSGTSAKQWLANNDVNEKCYYYWLRKLRRQAYDSRKTDLAQVTAKTLETVSFAEIPIPPNSMQKDVTLFEPSAVIKTASCSIAISNSISDRLLAVMLREVSHA